MKGGRYYSADIWNWRCRGQVCERIHVVNGCEGCEGAKHNCERGFTPVILLQDFFISFPTSIKNKFGRKGALSHKCHVLLQIVIKKINTVTTGGTTQI